MEPVIHFLLPLLFVLALLPKLNRRLVFILSPLTILPDFDWFFGHRYLFHNVFFILIVSLIVYIIFDKKKLVFFLALFFLASHLILELDNLGIGLFYPFYNKLIGINFEVYSSPGKIDFSYNVGFRINPLSMATREQSSPVFTKIGLFLSLLLIPVLIIKFSPVFRNKSL